MPRIRIPAHKLGGVLPPLDLQQLLVPLGPRALQSWWSIDGVSSYDECFDAVGKGAFELEARLKSGMRVAGAELSEIARDVEQVIWGEFAAYDNTTASKAWITITAVDSSWYDVHSTDAATLARIIKAFGQAERID